MAGIGCPTWWVSGVFVQTDDVIEAVTSRGPREIWLGWTLFISKDLMMSCQRQLADGSVRTVLAACQTLRTSICLSPPGCSGVPGSAGSASLKDCREKNGLLESPGGAASIDGGCREFWDLKFVFNSYDSESKFHSDQPPVIKRQ